MNCLNSRYDPATVEGPTPNERTPKLTKEGRLDAPMSLRLGGEPLRPPGESGLVFNARGRGGLTQRDAEEND